MSDGRWVYGFNARTGERQWRTGPPDIGAPEWIMAQEIEVDSGTGRGFERRVFVLADGELVLLDGDDGAVRWSVPVSGPPGSVPDETAFVSGVDGELVALDVVSGDELWNVPESRLELPPFEFGESVFVLEGSEIVALNSRSGRERGRAQLPEGSVSRFGVVAGRVIVAVGDQLLAVSSPG